MCGRWRSGSSARLFNLRRSQPRLDSLPSDRQQPPRPQLWVVEGACRHLVKDRMERAGMRWHPDGAQAMLDLRATYLNGEWETFWTYPVEQEDPRLDRKLRKTG